MSSRLTPRVQRHAACVHGEYPLAPDAVRRRDEDPAVEAPRSQQSRVEDLRAVRRGEHDHALVAAGEAVELREDLVQRLLALVVGGSAHAAAPDPAYGIELVDEDDRGRRLLRLLEQIAHAAGTHADHHLHELGR